MLYRMVSNCMYSTLYTQCTVYSMNPSQNRAGTVGNFQRKDGSCDIVIFIYMLYC